MTDEELLISLLFILVILIALLIVKRLQSRTTEEEAPKVTPQKITHNPNLIQDSAVDTNIVLEKLKQFKVKIIAGRKTGFTEKDIHKQLEIYLKEIFQTVTMEHGVDSKNSKAIDIDIGNGRVGIEVKLAVEILKESGWDRAIGQMVKYTRLKYNQGNFIVLVVGFDDDLRNSMLSDIEDDILNNKGKFWFTNAGSRSAVKSK